MCAQVFCTNHSNMLSEDTRVESKDATSTPDDRSSLFSSSSVEMGANNSAVAARKSLYDARYDNMRRRLREMWGWGNPRTPSEESRVTWPQRLYYTWVTDYIRVAAREELQVENLPSVPYEHTAHECGRKLSLVTQRSLYRRYGWNVFIGMNVMSSRDRTSRGTLRWVGVPQSGGYSSVVAAVTWTQPPAHRLAERSAGHSPFFRGAVHGETIFALEDRDNSTLEDPGTLEFIYDDGSDPALVDEIPKPRRLSVVRDLFAALPGCVLWQFPGRIVGDICTLTIPVLLHTYVAYLTSESPSWGVGIFLVLMLFLVHATQSVALHAFYYTSINGGLCFRSALTAVICEKCFVISPKSLAMPEMSVGRIINMVGTDVERANDFLQHCLYLWSSPIVFIGSIVFFYRLVGWCAFLSVLAIGTTLPINALVMRRMMRLRLRLAKVTDSRIKATNEFFSGIRIAKYMTWEPSFIADIEEKRDRELEYLRGVQTCRIAASFLNNATPPIVIALVFVLYSLLGNELSPETVFPAISLLTIIRIPFIMIPMVINITAQFFVSMARISAFLECENMSQGVADIHVYTAAQRAITGSLCEAAAVFENTDIAALMPVKLPRAPKVVLSLTAHLMRRFCCCCHCCEGTKRPSPTQVEEPQSSSGVTTASESKANGKRETKGPNSTTEGRFQLLPKDILRDVSIKVPTGKLTVVIGPTGSGKSTLLKTLLEDYEVTRGRVWATRSIAYVSQQPWIMNATLRENILFFAHEDPKRLQEAVRVCQLEPDLKLLPGGMRAEIGEKGINLSGGQKARVSLARAVYADRDLYLLDDPLSALDAHVGKRVLMDVLLGTLAHKTRVLVTHQLHLLSRADYIVVVGDCTVRFVGSPAEFFSSPLSKEIVSQDAEQPHAEEGEEEVRCGPDSVPEKDKDAPIDVQQSDNANGAIMTLEEKAVGSVPWSTYMAYIHACGGISIAVMVLLIFFFTEMLTLSSNVWLSIWSTKRFELTTSTYLKVYITLVFFGILTVPLRFYTAYRAMRRGSRNLHRLLLRSVSTGTMQFFDTTPLGRIVNRFSRDIDRIDDALQMTFIFFLQVVYGLFSSLVVTINSQPYVLIVLLPTAYLYYRLMRFYNAANREIRRVNGTVKAPMLSLIGEALGGSSTIRAYGCAVSIMKESLRRIDRVYASSFIENAANRWIGVRVEFLSNVIIFVIAFVGVVGTMTKAGWHDVGLLSLSLTLALASTPQLNWLVRMASSTEADMNSVERILYYAHNIDHEEMPEIASLVDEMRNKRAQASDATTAVVVEADNTTGDCSVGRLEFLEVEMRYRPGLPLALNKVTFRIEPRQKVGIVGRTGSGKSTLLLTFMRMVDICGGDIVVSGRSIRAYGLRELRRLFAMIPQDPVLFDGTVRSNLDPFCESTPAEVWQALELVGMRERVASEDGGIDSLVQEGGANFSVGQRQLLCLARALLRRGSVFILMDEATANIDQALDRQIQRTVMTAFASHTVITIAHRLHTVAAYDKIIVMDHGVVAESGAPRELLEDPSSKFSELVAALGRDEAAQFRASVGSMCGLSTII